jgi:hypothetical protein
MQADVIHGADFSVHVGDADGLVAAGEFFGFVGGGEIGLRGDFNEWHVRIAQQKEGPFGLLRVRMPKVYRSGLADG